eukprot:241200-Rhodomonas_salina.4
MDTLVHVLASPSLACAGLGIPRFPRLRVGLENSDDTLYWLSVDLAPKTLANSNTLSSSTLSVHTAGRSRICD